jgi:cytidine deaminase
MTIQEKEKIFKIAEKSRLNAYAPYSHFSVGAALLTASGNIYGGCNIENSSFGLTICAERVALSCAVVSGNRDIKALMLIADTADPITPCGACRQVLAEFNPNLILWAANLNGTIHQYHLTELLPQHFHLPIVIREKDK